MDKEVKIYVKDKCPFCNKLLEILDRDHVPYKKYNISDPNVSSAIITRDNHTPVPQVEMSGRIIFDYTTEEDLAEEIKTYLKG